MASKRMGKQRPLSKKQVKESVPNQSGVYNILNRGGDVVYTGMAGAGRLQDRLMEHLESGDIPGGSAFQIRPTSSSAQAQKVEANLIKRHQPKYNDQGK